jgi:hypothetical protein
MVHTERTIKGAASRSHYFKTLRLAAKYAAVLKEIAVRKREGVQVFNQGAHFIFRNGTVGPSYPEVGDGVEASTIFQAFNNILNGTLSLSNAHCCNSGHGNAFFRADGSMDSSQDYGNARAS